jgi:hypothetical protein
MGIKQHTRRGSGGGLGTSGGGREQLGEFCRRQGISLNVPAHVEAVDWPPWPAASTRLGVRARSHARLAASGEDG